MDMTMKWVQPLLLIWMLGTLIYTHTEVAHATAPGEEKRVQTLTAPNDPQLPKQNHLRQIHAEEAWNLAREAAGIKIAIVDTGVDLDHPDLKANLIPGVNLVQPNLPPRDDNGHGTNVAGVIAAVGNNSLGVSGVLWKAQLMPIKALDPNGRGDEERLTLAIRYAVDHGAKIVVLSVGLLSNDPALSEAVSFAEEQGVLLVAASGNDEGNVVRYPAAYPTVLAVGGVGPDNTVEDRSNFGSEIDVVAPWSVFTTAVGGRYETKEGTSMAAPQVAALAALVWQKHPALKPHEIRSMLRQTAEDIGTPGWDPYTGYGLIRADRALSEPYKADMYEPNDTAAEARTFPVDRMVSASFRNGKDIDWYSIEAPYDGTLGFTLYMDDAPQQGVSLLVERDAGGESRTLQLIPGESVHVDVRKGRVDLRLSLNDRSTAGERTYRLVSDFQIYSDPFEDNDKPYKAYLLPDDQPSVVGTFHRQGDEDWFQLEVKQSGTLQIRLDTDTGRIDPVLLVQRRGEKPSSYDIRGAGEPETTDPMDVLPGTYYIRATKIPDSSAMGEYTLSVTFSAKLVDPNEPNDKSFQATTVAFDYEYGGVFDYQQDTDWFQFAIREESYVDAKVNDIPSGRTLAMSLLDSNMNRVFSGANKWNEPQIGYTGRLSPGTYYIRLNADAPFTHEMYKLKVNAKPFVAGFIDIGDHWARQSVVRLSQRKIVEGNGTYRFQPEGQLTRAEAAAMIVRAFGHNKSDAIQFNDLPSDHWALPYIAKAAKAGIVGGYPDGSFRPDEPVTRMEMTAMLARALRLDGKLGGTVPFEDVAEDYWGTAVLKQMKEEGRITGYADGTFRPSQTATRAEFTSILAQIIT